MMMLPLHIACATGVSFETLYRLLLNYPESTCFSTGDQHPLDLFENGIAGLEYKQSCRILIKWQDDSNRAEDQLELMRDMRWVIGEFGCSSTGGTKRNPMTKKSFCYTMKIIIA